MTHLILLKSVLPRSLASIAFLELSSVTVECSMGVIIIIIIINKMINAPEFHCSDDPGVRFRGDGRTSGHFDEITGEDR